MTSGVQCRFESKVEEDVVGNYPWIVYTVLSELIMKIIPATLLVYLNTMIIRKVKRTRMAIAKNSMLIEVKDRNKSEKRLRFRSGKKQQFISKRDKNLINLFFVLYFLFLLCNIPMAIVRILIGAGIDTDTPTFREFRVLSNTLEVFFAASNFYLYCLCNMQIRRKVSFESVDISC